MASTTVADDDQPQPNPVSELWDVAPLAFSFGCALGSYWMLRGLKNAIFMELVGPRYIPEAKILSIGAVVLLLFVYTKLVDVLGKRRLLFCIYAVYAALFAGLTWSLDRWEDESSLGWWFYLAIETFGSLGISHLWSLAVNSTRNEELAARRFPMLVVGAQIGACTCTALTALLAPKIGLVPLLAVAVFLLSIAPLTARRWLERNHVRDDIRPKGGKAGLAEGLRLILARPYLLLILCIVLAYEFVGTYLDYMMNTAAKKNLGDVEQVAQFLGLYGFSANFLSLVFALTGTGFLVRRFGVNRCLVIYPTLLGLVVLACAAHPGLWSFFAAMIALKGIAYGFNKPCLEMLYIPTRENIQFKAKSWIDTAGSRGGKALGSVMNVRLPASLMVHGGAAICLALIVAWLFVAVRLGRAHRELLASGERLS